MAFELSATAPAALHAYYAILQRGVDAFDRAELRALLTDQLDFTGPIAGHRPDSTDAFLLGVKGFVSSARGIELIRDVHDDGGSAVLYEAALPAGSVTFAEFFTFDDGRIASLHLTYSGQDYLAAGGA